MELKRVLIDRGLIAARVSELGQQIAADYSPQTLRAAGAPADTEPQLVLVPVLTGAIVFVADLIRSAPVKMSIRPVTISSYPGTATSTQGAAIQGAVPTDLKGKHVLLVDDILDSGKTLGLLKRLIEAQQPASLRVAVLLRKDEKSGRRQEHVDVDYVGFDIPDEFVVGYGLDYDGYYRNLPDIGILG
jgi:hypoxanthine phosphoribosyltransferase